MPDDIKYKEHILYKSLDKQITKQNTVKYDMYPLLAVEFFTSKKVPDKMFEK